MPLAKCEDYNDIVSSITTSLDALSRHPEIETREDLVAGMQMDLGALLQSIQDCERSMAD